LGEAAIEKQQDLLQIFQGRNYKNCSRNNSKRKAGRKRCIEKSAVWDINVY